MELSNANNKNSEKVSKSKHKKKNNNSNRKQQQQQQQHQQQQQQQIKPISVIETKEGKECNGTNTLNSNLNHHSRRHNRNHHRNEKNNTKQSLRNCNGNDDAVGNSEQMHLKSKENFENNTASKITAAAALVNDIENLKEKQNGKINLTDSQKDTIEKILKKIFCINLDDKKEENGKSTDTSKLSSISSSSSSSLPVNAKSNDQEGQQNKGTENKNLNLMAFLAQQFANAKISKDGQKPIISGMTGSNSKEMLKYKDAKDEVKCHDNKNDNDDGDDDDDEYVEYVFKPRHYFFFSMCQFCKKELKEIALPCRVCFMTFYCSIQHMTNDKQHQQDFCPTLKMLAENQGGHIFNGINNLTGEHYRNFRVQMLRKCEEILNRELELYEKETILYPRLCCNETCREWKYTNLTNCPKCQQVAYCKNSPDHLLENHKLWCNSFSIMRKLIHLQEIYGNIIPDMPNEILTINPGCGMTMKNILDLLYKNNKIEDEISLANISQFATAPLTSWYTLKMSSEISSEQTEINVHLVGAEFHFEANILQKWEAFFLHLMPNLKKLNIVFIGPELFIPGISFDLLSKSKMCKTCRNENRKVEFKFENVLYHDYCGTSTYLKPDLICFFNPGLYRRTGFNGIDTWPETIRLSAIEKCPIIVTSYTEYESTLDMKRFLKDVQRCVNIILPPSINPFSSTKPERNFISDDLAPLIFKNFYCFIVK